MRRRKTVIAAVAVTGALLVGGAGVIVYQTFATVANNTARAAEAAKQADEQASEQGSVSGTDYISESDRAKLEAIIGPVKKQRTDEYNAVAAAYDLPEGKEYRFDYDFPELIQQLQEDQDGSGQYYPQEVTYEPGYFRGSALIEWQCAWIEEAVETKKSGRKARFNTAVAKLESFSASEDIALFPDYDAMLADLVTPLQNGDVSNAEDFVTYNCSHLQQGGR